MGILGTLSSIIGLKDIIFGVLDRVHASPQQKAELELALRQHESEIAQYEGELETRIMQAASANIQAEVASTSWMARSWRPLFGIVGSLVIWGNILIPALVRVYLVHQGEYALADTITPMSIPDSVYWLYGAGFLGYGGMRTWEKIMGAKLLK